MLELARIDPSTATDSTPDDLPKSAASGLAVGLARTAAEIEEIQRLRYRVFTDDMGAVFPKDCDGIDQDRFDQWCEHLMVRELSTQRIVGTYRILTPEKAREAGGYYSESEFDLSGLDGIRDSLCEFGRSCTHPTFRSGSVIMLLWSGLAEFLRRNHYHYVFGCASVSLRDDGVTAAEVWRATAQQVLTAERKVTPIHRYPVERLDRVLPARIPPLIKGYLKLGVKICGEPAWDPDFNAADFPMLLRIDEMDSRYRRHFDLNARGLHEVV